MKDGRAFPHKGAILQAPGDTPRGAEGKRMERRYRLKKNRAFQYVYRRGHSVACRNLVMLLAPGRELKIGFSVSKKTGNAVTRNKIKRRLRECFRPYLGDVKTGLYVIVARPSAAAIHFTVLGSAPCLP